MARAGYFIAGVALAAWGIFAASVRWVQLLCIVIGGAAIVEGIIGFCIVARAFGKGGKPANKARG